MPPLRRTSLKNSETFTSLGSPKLIEATSWECLKIAYQVKSLVAKSF